jgi:hypothetical protein
LLKLSALVLWVLRCGVNINMPQNINLYLDEFQYHEPPFSGRVIIDIAGKIGILIIFVLAISVAGFGIAYTFLENLNKEYDAVIKQLSEVQVAYPPRQLDAQLQKREAYLRNIVQNRKVLLNYLSQRTDELAVEAKQSYAMKLFKIASVVEDKAWVNQVEFRNKEVALSGMTLDYAVLPAYMTGLSAALAQEFKSFNLKPDKEKPIWRFRFNTDIEEFDDEQSKKEDKGASITVEKVLGRTQGD